jgi:hypothetical protein
MAVGFSLAEERRIPMATGGLEPVDSSSFRALASLAQRGLSLRGAEFAERL